MIDKLMHIAASAIAGRDALGFLTKAARKAQRLVVCRSARSIWFYRTLKDPIKPVQPGMDVEMVFLAEDKSGLIAWLKENSRSFPWIYIEKEVESALANGHIFGCVRRNDEIAGYVKIGIGPTYIHDFGRTIRFPDGVAFIYDTFVAPEYRGKRIGLYAVSGALNHLKRAGFKGVWCHIEEWNCASLKTFMRAGFTEASRIRFMRVLGMPLYIRGDGRPMMKLEPLLEARGRASYNRGQ
ncbi:MAG: GNAT family N-acetyltransferase [Deltaproteobacteria bacterium]|nr:GNAT family N-acetyltransferase [Deltaproteobacteria bacterium]